MDCMDGLEAFIIRAKAKTYVGNGAARPPCRAGAHDIGVEQGSWAYLDSYFGGTDFLGQEVVWHAGVPVWAMNYYGRVQRPDRIDAATAGHVIKQALSALYSEGRFLGGFAISIGPHTYIDQSDGDVGSFSGHEVIEMEREAVYRLDYHGGMIKA
jgi:hypothetical protein